MSNLVIPCDSRGNPVEFSLNVDQGRLLTDIFGSSESASGVRVDVATAMMVSAFRKAAGLVATAVAKCETHVYSVNGNTRTINRKHPADALVSHAPNAYQTAFEFDVQMELDLGIHGDAYAAILWNGRGQPAELLPLPKQNVRLISTPDGPMYEAYLCYENGGMRTFYLDQSEMLHLKWMPRTMFQGSSLLDDARNILGQLIAMQRYAGGFYKNSARPDVVIKHPGKFNNPTAREAFREDWRRAYGGADNAYKTVILDEGMDATLMGRTQSDSQYIETWRQCCIEVANFWHLPPSKVGMIEASAYKSLEQDELAAATDCYLPRIIYRNRAYSRALLSTAELKSGSAIIHTDTTALEVSDLTSRSTAMSKALGNNQAWRTINENRAMDNLNPVEGGDEPPRWNAHSAAPKKDPAPDDDTKDALSAALTESIQRAVSRSIHQLKRGHQTGGLAGAHNALAADMDKRNEIVSAHVRLLAAITRADAVKLNSEITQRLHGALCVAVSRAGVGEPESFEARLLEFTAPITQEISDHAETFYLRRAA